MLSAAGQRPPRRFERLAGDDNKNDKNDENDEVEEGALPWFRAR